MSIEQELIKFLDSVSNACLELKKSFVQTEEVVAQSIPLSPEDEFKTLKEALEGNRWPEAVNAGLICDPNSDADKIERGRGILELLIDQDLKGLKVLDYGCGEGFVAYQATDSDAAFSVGYDLIKNPKWKSFKEKENTIITNDFGLVTKNGPYDVIILFDVIDHLKNEDPVSVLKKAKELLAPTGKIYMRCHPLTSRHATHLYNNINKAFLHLIFDEKELKKLIPESIYAERNNGSKTPLMTYAKQVEEAGLIVVHKRELKEPIEEFFRTPLIANRIKRISGHNELPEFQMSLSFIDMVLQKS